MKHRIGVLAVAASLALCAESAFAQDGRLTIEGVDYIVPSPEGYCAGGKVVDAYMAAQADQRSAFKPDAMMVPCSAEELSFDFYGFRVTPDKAKRTPFLAELKATLPAAIARPSLVDEGALEKAFGGRMTIDAGIRPVSVDEICGYIAGAVRLSVGDKQMEATIVGCATVIGGRVTYVFRYRPGTDTASAVAAIPEVRHLALAIRPAGPSK